MRGESLARRPLHQTPDEQARTVVPEPPPSPPSEPLVQEIEKQFSFWSLKQIRDQSELREKPRPIARFRDHFERCQVRIKFSQTLIGFLADRLPLGWLDGKTALI